MGEGRSDPGAGDPAQGPNIELPLAFDSLDDDDDDFIQHHDYTMYPASQERNSIFYANVLPEDLLSSTVPATAPAQELDTPSVTSASAAVKPQHTVVRTPPEPSSTGNKRQRF